MVPRLCSKALVVAVSLVLANGLVIGAELDSAQDVMTAFDWSASTDENLAAGQRWFANLGLDLEH
jgi:hypothetical protein